MIDLPRRFCWTKYGSEAGESVDSILRRKEEERLANGGVFLWGIGNSVGPGVRRLVELEEAPMVVFSPMKAAAKQADVRPPSVVTWSRAFDLNGDQWEIPRGSTVTSRGSSSKQQKRVHYALVCHSDRPLQLIECDASVQFDALRNLESGNPLGFSQVTAVVERVACGDEGDLSYSVGFAATLVFPYFVCLSEPMEVGGRPASARQHVVQTDLLHAK